MSYILDALKKAERERRIAQVPSLSTVHDFRARSPLRLWVASAAILLCIAAAVLFFVFFVNSDSELTSSPIDEANDAAAKIQMSQNEDLDSTGNSFTSTRIRESPSVPEAEAIGQNAYSVLREPDTLESSFVPSTLAPAASRPDQYPQEVMVQELVELPQESGVSTGTEEAESTDNVEGTKTVSFKDAMSDLSISILFFADNRAERLVFINGKKYVEGDIIEGKFLLESITQEGAVLNYNGERVLLQPGSN